MSMERRRAYGTRAACAGLGLLLCAFAVGCGRKGPASGPAPAPLGELVGQSILVTPVQRARLAPELGWPDAPRPAELTTLMDSALAAAFREREVGGNWATADALVRSRARNPTYATDPKALSVEPLTRPGNVQSGSRLPEPLASQLRTMVALHEGRLVLIPIELRLESAAPAGAEVATGRAVLRLVIVDARMSDVRWMSEVGGEAVPAFGPDVIREVARKVANLFATVN